MQIIEIESLNLTVGSESCKLRLKVKGSTAVINRFISPTK